MTPVPKPAKTLRQLKARKDRHEAAVFHAMRAEVFARDGGKCAVLSRLSKADMLDVIAAFKTCAGRLELAHLKGARRSQTRKQDPHVRHDSRRTLALCAVHHEAEEHKGLRFIGLTKSGMDGPICYHVEPPKARVM